MSGYWDVAANASVAEISGSKPSQYVPRPSLVGFLRLHDRPSYDSPENTLLPVLTSNRTGQFRSSLPTFDRRRALLASWLAKDGARLYGTTLLYVSESQCAAAILRCSFKKHRTPGCAWPRSRCSRQGLARAARFQTPERGDAERDEREQRERLPEGE